MDTCLKFDFFISQKFSNKSLYVTNTQTQILIQSIHASRIEYVFENSKPKPSF